MRSITAMHIVVSVSVMAAGGFASLRAQSDSPSVRIEWMGRGDVLLGLEQVPSNVVVQVSGDLEGWSDLLDVRSRSNRVSVFDRGALLRNGGVRFYRLRAPGVSVESAHALWQSQGLHSYSYHFQRTCYCVPEVIREADVTVREDQVVRATNVVYGQWSDPWWVPPEQPDVGSLMTIEQFFGMVVTAQEGYDLTAVSYDPVLGFPGRIAINRYFEMADDEDEYVVDRVRPEGAPLR